MATWIAHLRVAENVLKDVELDRGLFLIGNLAPDCNKPNEDWSSFTPDAQITHFQISGTTTTEPDKFLDEYYRPDDELSRKSFMLGYFAHLLTDNLWGEMIRKWKDENPEIKDKMNRDKSYIWTIKNDWYGQDFKYLRENVNNVFVDEFLGLDEVIDYLNFFPSDIMNEKLEYIKEYYRSEVEEIKLNEYKYLTTDQMDEFVSCCSDVIKNKLMQVM